MKYNSSIIALLLCVICHKPSFSQEKNVVANEKQLTYKVSSYSVEADKLVQKEFKDNNSYQIVYTCIPAGILVIELKSEASLNDKEIINGKLKKSHKDLNFIQLEGITLKDAEEKCSQSRSVN